MRVGRSRILVLLCGVLIVYALWSAFNTLTTTTVYKNQQWKVLPDDVTPNRGMVLCVGNEAHFINGALYTIQQLRQRWKSDLPVSIVHCNELYTDSLAKFAQYEHVRIDNICDPMSRTPLNKQQRSRLKGWFCKPQALLSSMYDETMIVDTDVLWFKDPTALFQAPSYLQTGALFFRDRFLFESDVEKDGLQYDKVKQFVETQAVLLASGIGRNTDSGSRSSSGGIGSSSSRSDRTNSLSVSSHTNISRINGINNNSSGSSSNKSISNSSSEVRTSVRTRGGGSSSSAGSGNRGKVSVSSTNGNSTHYSAVQSSPSSSHQGQGSVLVTGLGPGQGQESGTHEHHHHGLNFTIDASVAAQWSISNGINFFWRHGINEKPQQHAIRHVQESSVVLFHKSRLPNTLHILQRMLPIFTLGYGDKEIYWIASTIANEPFSFEPYLAGTYGDCGEILHFDPIPFPYRDNVEPYFLNCQYLTEGIEFVGKNKQDVVSKPVPVTSQTSLFDMGEKDLKSAGRCGACKLMGCNAVPPHINEEIIRYQQYHVNNIQKVDIFWLYHKITVFLEKQHILPLFSQ